MITCSMAHAEISNGHYEMQHKAQKLVRQEPFLQITSSSTNIDEDRCYVRQNATRSNKPDDVTFQRFRSSVTPPTLHALLLLNQVFMTRNDAIFLSFPFLFRGTITSVGFQAVLLAVSGPRT